MSIEQRAQPRVRRNEWHHLTVPPLGSGEPTLSVSVVIPAWNARRLLPTVLAALAAQSYPPHLLEVVVADDGPEPLQLPEVRPERTRIVPVRDGWGRANACSAGAAAADGEILHWLDADMLVEAEHVEAQLRWHHLSDHAVVLGHKWFVDPGPVLGLSPAEIRDGVAAGRVERWFEGREREGHDWVEAAYQRTDDLRYAGWRALRTHVGATASVARGLYDDAGGMDTSLRLGEDISLGYRLAEAGAFFVPDREARSWHLGRSTVMSRQQEVNGYNDPFHADTVPDLRPKRHPGRHYAVPYLEVVLDVREPRRHGPHGHDRVTRVVDAVLASTLSDLVVTLLDNWSALDEDRRPPLDDPMLSSRLLRAGYRSDQRVRLVESLPAGRSDAMLRLVLPSADWAPRSRTLLDLTQHLERTHDGLRSVLLPDGSVARLERTAAFARARRVARPGEDIDDVVEEVAGTAWLDAGDLGFADSLKLWRPELPGTAGPPMTSDEAWAHIEELHARRSRKGGQRQEETPRAAGAGGAAGAAAARAEEGQWARSSSLRSLVRRLRGRR